MDTALADSTADWMAEHLAEKLVTQWAGMMVGCWGIEMARLSVEMLVAKLVHQLVDLKVAH